MLLQQLRADYRLGPFSIADTLGSLAIVYFIAPWLSALFRKIGFEVPRSSWLWLTVPVAFIVHIAFRPDTPLTQMFFDPTGNYLAKLALITMLYLGFRDIKRIK